MPEPRILLQPECCYHLYNHAVGSDLLFTDNSDYLYFFNKLKKYIVPVADIFGYCLMPNHFHLIIRIKNKEKIEKILEEKFISGIKVNELSLNNPDFLNEWLSRIFSNFFNAYAKYYNRKNNRRGSIFKRAFQRKAITDLNYLCKLICYVHQNPVAAGLTDHPSAWIYSSYNAIIGTRKTLIEREETIRLFDDIDNFIYCNSSVLSEIT
jgi:putative transposase